MLAIQFPTTGDAHVLQAVEVAKPTAGPGEILVKTKAISVNYADTMMRRGEYPAMPPLPAIPGLECSGVVEAVGAGVSDLQPGQPVVVMGQPGCYAEYVAVDRAAALALPAALDFDVAAALPVNYFTAYHMLHTLGHLQPGQTLLLYAAAGGVGVASIQLAKQAGVRVIGLTSSAAKAKFATQQGADHVIDYKTEDVRERVMELTDGAGVDLIFNCAAGTTLARDFDVLAPMGQIIWFGFTGGPPVDNVTELLGRHFMTSLGIRAFVVYSIFDRPDLLAPSAEVLLGGARAGALRPHIAESMPLAEAARAHELLESGTVCGKLLLRP